ncbi:hypothetical protein ROJ8625_02213 [Roseivivax jejudonensis]|uniref:Uncharacterized protein n=1 Tax=Roseivivax jejudonensis TaxID=1529041 RepID=A0A1X6ZB42_9RHOB|nr:hypothetical protein ROJ8625_02213 [Roseivivax jejudonensis]
MACPPSAVPVSSSTRQSDKKLPVAHIFGFRSVNLLLTRTHPSCSALPLERTEKLRAQAVSLRSVSFLRRAVTPPRARDRPSRSAVRRSDRGPIAKLQGSLQMAIAPIGTHTGWFGLYRRPAQDMCAYPTGSFGGADFEPSRLCIAAAERGVVVDVYCDFGVGAMVPAGRKKICKTSVIEGGEYSGRLDEIRQLEHRWNSDPTGSFRPKYLTGGDVIHWLRHRDPEAVADCARQSLKRRKHDDGIRQTIRRHRVSRTGLRVVAKRAEMAKTAHSRAHEAERNVAQLIQAGPSLIFQTGRSGLHVKGSTAAQSLWTPLVRCRISCRSCGRPKPARSTRPHASSRSTAITCTEWPRLSAGLRRAATRSGRLEWRPKNVARRSSGAVQFVALS